MSIRTSREIALATVGAYVEAQSGNGINGNVCVCTYLENDRFVAKCPERIICNSGNYSWIDDTIPSDAAAWWLPLQDYQESYYDEIGLTEDGNYTIKYEPGAVFNRRAMVYYIHENWTESPLYDEWYELIDNGVPEMETSAEYLKHLWLEREAKCDNEAYRKALENRLQAKAKGIRKATGMQEFDLEAVNIMPARIEQRHWR